MKERKSKRFSSFLTLFFTCLCFGITFSEDDEKHCSIDPGDANNQLDSSYEPSISSSNFTEPMFSCGDPYDSYDWEC